ncbi:hypothetical protein IFM89_036537 [Coptis chinensis]|uniref:pectinesterase n=1 Tax=Coptis chinensis TaxID=261450 RepID=A0A835M806_9MAGN|nr:hypothetical protein IFM89_036537 [Coptis chinensis]
MVLSVMSAESWVVPTKQLDQTVIKTITVGSNGDYSTIQSAIDSVSSNNDNWIRVYVKGGDYRGKVVIPQDKPYIILEGDESATTTILWNDYDDIEKPTFAVLADNFVAKSVSFKSCSIHVTGEVLGPGFVGFITAQTRSSPKENTGFVFKSCRVFGCGVTFLGRAWGRYSRVMFYQSDISNVVVPLGWDAWNFTGNEYEFLSI